VSKSQIVCCIVHDTDELLTWTCCNTLYSCVYRVTDVFCVIIIMRHLLFFCLNYGTFLTVHYSYHSCRVF